MLLRHPLENLEEIEHIYELDLIPNLQKPLLQQTIQDLLLAYKQEQLSIPQIAYDTKANA